MEYTPHDSGKACIGWTTENTKDRTNLSQDDVMTSVEISGNTNLYPVIVDAHWILFESEGGDPVSSRYVLPSASVTSLSTTTRTGYTFDGWYTSASGGTRVTDGDGNVTSAYQSSLSSLSSDLTVYAHWTGNTVNYTIAYWQENADDDGYTYKESVTVTGTAGEKTTVSGSSYAASDRYEGFHLYGSDTTNYSSETNTAYEINEQTISGYGSTVVNVYYNRNVYSIRFYVYQENSDGSYYYFPGGYVKSNNRYVYYSEGYYTVGEVPWSYSKNYFSSYYVYYYTRSYNSSTGSYSYTEHSYDVSTYYGLYYYTALEISAKYEADIRDQWPSTKYPNDFTQSAWKGDDGYIWTGQYTMPLGGKRYYTYDTSGDYTIRRSYYLMDTEGNYPSTESFHEDMFSSEYTIWSLAAFYSMKGFTVDADRSDQLNAKVSELDSSNNIYGWTIYYSRNQYDVEFYNGSDQIAKKTYYYEADISNAAQDLNVTAPAGYTFDGWYSAPASAGYGEEYQFTGKTMPAGNVVVYAKFSRITHDVSYEANGGHFSDNTTTKTDTLDYGGQAIEYEVTRDNKDYEFVGWFRVEDGAVSSTPYNFSDGVTEDMTLRAVWRRSGTYQIIYNSGEGGSTITDSNTYLDAATVTVAKAPETVPDKKVFAGWKLTTSSGEFTYQPGAQFDLDVDTMDQSSDGQADNKITLTAVYDDVDTTSIRLHGNGSTDAAAALIVADGITQTREGYTPEVSGSGTADVSVSKLELNASIDLSKVTATRTGYELVGWSTDPNESATDFTADNVTKFAVGATVAVDNSSSGNNDLYAVWRESSISTDPEEAFWEVTKTFSGITDASLIPGTFSISLSEAGAQTLNKSDATQGADSSGNVTLTWKITGAATSGTYKWSETNADKVDGYKLTSATTGSKTLAAADITFPAKKDIIEVNSNSSKSFAFGEKTIFAALLTDDNVVVVTSRSMNDSQRKAVESKLLPNMPQGNWTKGTVSYYTISQLSGDGLKINGGTLSYSSRTISFSDTSIWAHAAYAEMSGAGLTQADISVTNTYQKSNVPLTGIFHANDARTILFTLLALGAVAGVGTWLRRKRRLW